MGLTLILRQGAVLATAFLAGQVLAADVQAEPAAPEPRTGITTPRRATTADPQQTYALYLPADYVAGDRRPVMLLMDPRGQALVPLERFRPVAERLGWVLVSSYNTASDGSRDPNIATLRALLPEIDKNYAPAPGRLYLAGFSGTARLAWDVGALMGDRLAGLVGVGAGRPPSFAPSRSPTFAFFGAAGVGDFNYEEMRVLDDLLATGTQPHRFVSFAGPHAWPPAEVCTAAVEWMEIQAMHRGLRPKDEDLVAALHSAATERARRLEIFPADAAEAWAAIQVDFDGLTDISAARDRARQLSARRTVIAARKQQRELLLWRDNYQARFSAWLTRLNAAASPPLTGRSLSTLDMAGLQRRRDSSDLLEAQAAQRLLAHIFTYTAFYEARRYLAEERTIHALAVLAVADAIQPGSPQVCLGKARAYAQSGQQKKGLKALRCMEAAGMFSLDFVAGDPGLAPLRKGEAYRQLVAGWGTASP